LQPLRDRIAGRNRQDLPIGLRRFRTGRRQQPAQPRDTGGGARRQRDRVEPASWRVRAKRRASTTPCRSSTARSRLINAVRARTIACR
jgi:hypothetical protein